MTNHADGNAPRAGPPSTWRLLPGLSNNALFVGLVLALIGGIAALVANRAADRRQEARDRLALVQELEPWLSDYLTTIRDSANLAYTYGEPGHATNALRTIQRLREAESRRRASTTTRIATALGEKSVAAYLGIDQATLKLEHCFGVLEMREADASIGPLRESERKPLQDHCSSALRELAGHRDSLSVEIARRLADDAGRDPGEISLTRFQWVRATILAEGVGREAVVSGRRSFTYSWSAPDATACQLDAPTGVSGVARRGVDGPVVAGHPWYPTEGRTTVLRLACTNGWDTGTDSLVLR